MDTDLFAAVAALIDPTKVRIFRDDVDKGEWQVVPSLWVQLQSSAQWGSGQGGATLFGSRPVISTGVVSLVIEIQGAVTEAAVELGCCRRTVPESLRAVAATLKDADQVQWWVEHLRGWSSDARNQLRLDPQRPKSARGARCPECGERYAHKRADGETVRVPALSIQWVGPADDDYHPDSDWRIRAVQCLACNTAWFRGSSLDALVDAMMLANEAMALG